MNRGTCRRFTVLGAWGLWLLTLATPRPAQGDDETLCTYDGDVTGNGAITAGDAQSAFAIVLGTLQPTWRQGCAADCNGSGSVTAADAQQIFAAALGFDACVGGCGPDAYEPDDSTAAASPLTPGEPPSHSLCPAGDSDWFSFGQDAARSVVVSTSGPAGDTRIRLFDENAALLAEDDDGGAGRFSRVAVGLAAGRYLVEVTSYDPAAAIPAYSVSLGLDPEVACGDGADDDGDGLADCADADCAGEFGCEPGAERSCGDGRDNDGDAAPDCADPDCAASAFCTVETCVPAFTEIACGDAIEATTGGEENQIGAYDCEPEPLPGPERYYRFSVPTPASVSVRLAESSARLRPLVLVEQCADAACVDFVGAAARFAAEPGVDYFVVVDGPEPTGATFALRVDCLFAEVCIGGSDEDGDGATDCADDDCFPTPPCEPYAETSCFDGFDNDGDGQTDCRDGYCQETFDECTPCDRDPYEPDDEVGGATPLTPGEAQTHSLCPRGDLDWFTFEILTAVEARLATDGPFSESWWPGSELTLYDANYVPLITAHGTGYSPWGVIRTALPPGRYYATVAMRPGSERPIAAYTVRLSLAPENDCDDGRDDDGDLTIDCRDPDCQGRSGCLPGPEMTCDDFLDNDGDGPTDCDDDDCTADPSCTVFRCEPNNPPLACGATLRASTRGRPNQLAAYDCSAAPLPGGEQVYPLAVVAPTAVTVRLLSSDADLRLALLADTCSDNACVRGLGSGTQTYALAPGRNYFLVVDSASPRPADFTLALDCALGEDCLNARDDDGDGQADCQDADCYGSDGCGYGLERQCFDGRDEDGNGQTDCDDEACVTSCQVRCEADGYEPDDDLAQATPLLPDTPQAHTMCRRGIPWSDDYYRLELPNDATVFVGDPRRDQRGFDAVLYDATGQQELMRGDRRVVDFLPAGSYVFVAEGRFMRTAGYRYDAWLVVGPEADCADGVDNDGDGATDCQEPECGWTGRCRYAVEGLCRDEFDNDGDGTVDCFDPDCQNAAECAPAGCGPLAPPLYCTSEVVGHTGAGVAFMADYACGGGHAVGPEVVHELVVDPGQQVELGLESPDGVLSLFLLGPECTAGGCQGTARARLPLRPEAGSLYFVAVDGPVAADYRLTVTCRAPEDCENGADDDGDGLVDCADPDCAGVGPCDFGAEARCTDGLDNDTDGQTDCADGDCVETFACPPTCVPDAYEPDDLPPPAPVTWLQRDVPQTHSLCPGGDADSFMFRVDGLAEASLVTFGLVGGTDLVLFGEGGFEEALDVAGGGYGAFSQVTTWLSAGTYLAVVRENAEGRGFGVPRYDIALSTWPETRCDDHADEDGDGTTDCADYDCTGAAHCEYPTERLCGDGHDNDGDALIDCADPDCAGTPDCFTAACTPNGATLGCGSAVRESTAGLPRQLERYDCAWWPAPGPERIYPLRVSAPQTVTVSVGPTSERHDVFVLAEACADNACVAASFAGQTRFLALPGTTYYLVVDSRGLVGSDFLLTVDCALGEDCTSSGDDDADGLADCADPDCDGLAGCEPGGELHCEDGLDNDGDGFSDCADLDCAALPICAADACVPSGKPIACGQTVLGDTGDGENHIEAYDCVPWAETGPEVVYTLVSAGGLVVARLDDESAATDLFLLSERCRGDACVAASESVALALTRPGETLYVVVDGRYGDSGPYELTVTCP